LKCWCLSYFKLWYTVMLFHSGWKWLPKSQHQCKMKTQGLLSKEWLRI
jgi:hypothetical protein